MERSKRLVELVGDPNPARAFLVDVQPMKQGLVQPAALVFVAAPVERLGIVEQLKARLDQFGSGFQVLVRRTQAGSKPLSLQGDLMQLGTDLGRWQCAVCRQVDEVSLLRVQRSKLFGELRMEELGRVVVLVDEASEFSAKLGDVLRREADGGVVGFYGGLDTIDLGVGKLTRAVVATGAEEVVIGPSLTVRSLLEDHAAAFAVSAQAGATEQGTLELMMVHPS